MLGEDACVLLVHADAVADLPGLAEVVDDPRGEVGDVAEAVAPEFERVRPLSDEVLAGVEVVLPRPHGGGVAVGDDHLRDRRPVEDHPRLVAVGEGDVVEDEALAHVEADVEGPLLPLDVVAVGDGEARALGLGDLDRLLARAQRARELGVGVVAVLGGHRHDAQIDDLVDGAVGDVDVGDEAVDGVRPRAVARVLLVEGEAAEDPPALLLWVLEDPGRERGDTDLVERDLPLRDRLLPGGIGGEDLLDDGELLLHDGELAGERRVHLGDGFDGAMGGGDDDVPGGAGGLVEDEGAEAAVDVRRRPGLATDGIEEAEVGHARRGGEEAGVAEHLGDSRDLSLGGQGERGRADVGRRTDVGRRGRGVGGHEAPSLRLSA